ncbi:MAG: response regulator transcription factor [Dehalococcoidia bacterium]
MLQERTAATEDGRAAPEAAGPVRVFLVEDHQVVREGTRRLIEANGDIRVIGETASGEDAVASQEISTAHVVLCDLMLPGIDGIETTRRILERYPDLRVVMLSSFGDDHVLEALDAGAAGYLLKKADGNELARGVREAASGGTPLSPSLSTLLVARLRDRTGHIGPLDLTSRQKEVLRMVARGEATKQIAEHLFMSAATVKRELRQIFDRLGVSNRAHAVAQAQQKGII